MSDFGNIETEENGNEKIRKGKILLGLSIVLLIAAGIVTAAYSLNILGSNGKPVVSDPIVLVTDAGSTVKDSGGDNPGGDNPGGSMPVSEPPRLTRREGVYTFLVFGVDESGYNTDVIMLVVYDTERSILNILNIPRDTYSVANDRTNGLKHINLAYSRGGLDQLKYEVMNLIGYSVDWYVKINMDGFKKLINYIGGVDFYVPEDMKYDDPSQNLHIDLKKGQQRLWGNKALQFIRYREKKLADIGRIDRRSAFLKATAEQLLKTHSVIKAGELAGVVFDHIDTDLKSSDLVWFAKKAVSIKPENINFHRVPGTGAKDSGMWIPYRNELLTKLNEHFNPFTKPIENINIVVREENEGK
jgi:LCP family protein required for cell wall assembly